MWPFRMALAFSAGEMTSLAPSSVAPQAPTQIWMAVPPQVRRLDRVHRALSLAITALGLLVIAPLMALIALAIKLTSRGPVLFSQVRVGIDQRADAEKPAHCRRHLNCGGKPFRIYKFRTMYHDPGNGDRQVWAQPGDPRVTPVGRFLRRYRLDELPQLYNVLRGDMNIVGPRPEQPNIFRALCEEIHGYSVRQRVRPGITGLAQVSLHYDRSLADVRRKVAYDLEYIVRRSLRTDFQILLRTIPTVLLKRGAW